MSSHHGKLMRAGMLWVITVLLVACSSQRNPSEGDGRVGTISMALNAVTGGHAYRLTHATFTVSGPTPATLSSEDQPDAGQLLSGTLKVGSYSVQLDSPEASPWSLERLDASSWVPVQAALISPNPVTGVVVSAGATTPVKFEFATDGTIVTLGDTGSLAIGIGVSEIDAALVPEAPSPTKLVLGVDPPTISTELGTTHTIMLTLTASNGFSGLVTLAASLVDANNQSMTGWSIAVTPTTLTLPLDGQATATATVTIPTENKGLAASANFVATSTAQTGVNTAGVAIDVLNRYSISMTTSQGQCVYPPPGIIPLTLGTKVRWTNDGTDPIVIHVDSAGTGCGHQDPGSPSLPGDAYECTLTSGAGVTFQWYCHSPGPTVNDRRILVGP